MLLGNLIKTSVRIRDNKKKYYVYSRSNFVTVKICQDSTKKNFHHIFSILNQFYIIAALTCNSMSCLNNGNCVVYSSSERWCNPSQAGKTCW